MYFESNKKEFKDLDNVSVTAFRIISILKMLLKEPLNDEEINKKLQENIENSRSLSRDTICIYINTLRSIGCEISRPCKNNNYKYILKYHPFKLNFSQDEINAIVEVRKYVSMIGDWKSAIKIDELFNLVIKHMDMETKKYFSSAKKTALCREIALENITKDLDLIESYCKQKSHILITYDSPNSGEKEISIKAEKLTLENGSFYLWGYNYEVDESFYLRLDRVKSINLLNIKEESKQNKAFEVKYKLTGRVVSAFIASDTEKILEKNNNELIIQAKVINKFKFIQDILSYGADCVVLSPDSIKKEVISKYKKMAEAHKDVYVE